ncbi:MAG: hypothetical protein K5694_06805 [Bacilli bacterium]|nr:hypothetical protein [Bacilli bacterium]
MRKTSKKLMAALLLSGTFALALLPEAQSKEHEQALEADPVVYNEEAVYNAKDMKMEEEDIVTADKVILHYSADVAVTDLRFYVWVTGVDGVEYMYDDISTDQKSMTITLDFVNDERFTSFAGLGGMYFIIKVKEVWTGQSDDTYLDYSLFPPVDGVCEVWCIPGEGSAVDIYATEAETKMDKILTAQFSDWKTLGVKSTIAPTSWSLYAYTLSYIKADSVVQKNTKSQYLLKSGDTPSTTPASSGGVNWSIALNYMIHPNVRYVLEAVFPTNPSKTMTKNVGFELLYETERFEKYYNYSGTDLGVTYSKEQTVFKVWAPTATRMMLNIYMTGTPANILDAEGKPGSNSKFQVQMAYREGGIWTATYKGNMKGRYYTYYIYGPAGNFEVVDPYATACGISGIRGAVVNMDETDPEGWDDVPEKWDGVEGYDIKSRNELSVYEVHVKDLTYDESWTGESERGTYSAFAEAGTTYTSGSKTVKTGFDHIEEMGVKAIQLMPIYDQDNAENDPEFYNWGYNPLNYNCLEGSYATDPYNATSRISEFKNLVKAYAENENKTRVIMDVVYNHVSSAPGSSFNKLMPRYYFRYTSDWSYYNGSGCGNEVKTEAPMMRKFIVESLCHWAKEYKIKGFRFDLMGLIDCDTLKLAATELYKIDPDIVMYGEGWRGDGDVFHGKGTPAETGNAYAYLSGTSSSVPVGAFNDTGRNALRGGNDQGWGSSSHLPGWGYMQCGPGDASYDSAAAVSDMLLGIHRGVAAEPEQCVNYASCHDNWTLYDQLYYTLGDSGKGIAPQTKTVIEASSAAQAAINVSNGIAFMQGGEEIFRSKTLDEEARAEVEKTTYEKMYSRYVSHNSYNAPARVNSYKWGNKISVDGVDVAPYLESIKTSISLHHSMKKYLEGHLPTAGTTSSLNHYIENTFWNGKSKDNSDYYGACGFQIDEYFVFLAGRCWAYVGFSDVPKSTLMMSSGEYSYDNYNGTVNVGNYDADTGGAIAVFERKS